VANAAVPRARHEDGFELPAEAVHSATVPALPRQSWLPLLLWAIFAALFFGFLFFGSVRVGAGNWTGRRMRITQIWSDFLGFLAGQGASVTVISVVVLMSAVALIGGAGLVWLALRLHDQPSDTLPEPSSDS
jgi:hypothetical protein